MITFVLTPDQTFTHERVVSRAEGFRVSLLTYKALLGARRVPRATYIFTDFDRIGPYAVEAAARVYRRLRDHGLRVLNDPARILSRYGLLRALHLAGINQFNAYRAEEGATPARWPVFLRTDYEHTGPLTGLLHSMDEVRRELDAAVADGAPLSRLMIVEFAAEPIRPGLYRKLSIYRLGKASVADTCVHHGEWVAKIGKDGVAPPELYEDEWRIVRDNPYAEIVGKAFDIAGVDYGRADFALVQGRLQIYEINLTPFMELLGDSPSPFRSESRRRSIANYFAALRALDTPDEAGTVELHHPAPRSPRRSE